MKKIVLTGIPKLRSTASVVLTDGIVIAGDDENNKVFKDDAEAIIRHFLEALNFSLLLARVGDVKYLNELREDLAFLGEMSDKTYVRVLEEEL